jgi:hypothetical protein
MDAMRLILAIVVAMGVQASLGVALGAEDSPQPRLGATGTATVRLEFLGKGLIPTARVLISNPEAGRLRLGRRWTYEVIPQTAIVDQAQLSRLPSVRDDSRLSVAELASLPESRIFLTLAEDLVFRGGSDDRTIAILPGKAWGHDHQLDLRPAKLSPGIVYIRLALTTVGGLEGKNPATVYRSDWERYRLPDVPDVPLVRFDADSRKLGNPQFERAARTATVFTATAVSGDFPWTRVLTLDASDPLAVHVPRLLLDGKSTHVIPDNTPMRFAITGYDVGQVEPDARVIAVSLPP